MHNCLRSAAAKAPASVERQGENARSRGRVPGCQRSAARYRVADVTKPSRDVEVVELKHEPPAEHIPLSRDRQAALEASDRALEDRRWRNADLQRQVFGRKIGLIKG